MGKLYGGRGNYNEFDIGYDDGYYYDNNQYISDGHDYFDNFDYVNSEYINNGVGTNDVYFENLSDYGRGYAQEPSIYDISSKINNTLTQELEYDMYGNNYLGSNKYAGNYTQNSSAAEFFNRHTYAPSEAILPEDIEFDDAYIVQSQYFDDEDKLITSKDILSLLICILLAFALAYFITEYIVQHTQVDGTSMLYNFQHEDILIIDKLSYKFNEPKRFDVIIFPTSKNVYYIKRIIGMPGEHLVIKSDGTIYINDQLLPEDYGFETITTFGNKSDFNLGENEYFVLGDNRNHSEDSRYNTIGLINGDIIVGKAIFRIWPLDNFGLIDHSVNATIKKGGVIEGADTTQ